MGIHFSVARGEGDMRKDDYDPDKDGRLDKDNLKFTTGAGAGELPSENIGTGALTEDKIAMRFPKYSDIGSATQEQLLKALEYHFSEVSLADPLYIAGPTHGQGANAFAGAALAPNGKIIFAPHDSENVGIYDPVANTYTAGPVHSQGAAAFAGAALAPNGKIIFAPYSSANVGVYEYYIEVNRNIALYQNLFDGGI